MRHLLTVLLLSLVGAASFAQSNSEDRTIMTYRAEFDTLRHVGYNYVFGTDNPREYHNDIDFGTLVFTDSKVGIVSECVYETYFENSIIKSLRLSTDNKNATSELRELATLICPDFDVEWFPDGPMEFQAKVILSDKLCLVSYSEDKHSKNAVLEVKEVDVVLN